jgi:molecular chaperone DnaK
VGGSTRSPIISQLLEDRLGMPAHQEVHPDLCVALGAGVQGAMIAGIDAGPVLVDITPHSLGVRCVGLIDGIPTDRKFSVIIPRNTALPVTRSEVYYTCVDNQESVTIEVYQGEHVDATKNVLVGEFHVEGLSEVPAGNEIVDSMTLNLDGVLDVSATEKRTGRRGQIRIENALSRFRREEREAARQRLDELFDRGAVPASISAGAAATDAPSADPSPTPDLEHAVVQFQDLIERGERLLPHASPEDRTEIQTRIANLRQAIAERCETLAREESERLAEVLFFIEETTAAN